MPPGRRFSISVHTAMTAIATRRTRVASTRPRSSSAANASRSRASAGCMGASPYRLGASRTTCVAAAARCGHDTPDRASTRAMDLTYSPEELAFQREVRAWLKANVPKKGRSENPVEGAPDRERIARSKAWQRKVHDAGYLAMGWPKEYGGQGAEVMRLTILHGEG